MIALLLSLAFAAPAPEPAPEPPAAIAPAGPTAEVHAALTLRVPDRAAALDRAVKAAEASGGWFAELTDESARLRVPAARTGPLVEELRGLGELVERSYTSTDRGAELEELRAKLASRQAMLAKYEEVLKTASVKAVVAVERDMTRLVQEIEGIEGRIRLAQDRVRFSEVRVTFTFRDRAAPRRDGSSSFAWLNTMNVADFLDDLQTGRRATRSRLPTVAPEGFAPFPRPRRFQAVSPDDVAFRVRSVKNRPRADLAFWKEALRTRMAEAGYHVVTEQDIAGGPRQGYVLELGAANGPQDQAYLVAIFVEGRHIVVVEATGEAERFAARRAAVLAAIGQVGG